MGISAGASLLGKGANAIFNDRPDIPDFTSEVAGKFDEAKRSLSRKQDRQTDQVQADAAAAGVNPVTAMADVIESNNQAQADLQAKEADAMAAAENKEKQMKYGRGQQKYQARAQGIGSLVNAVSTGASNKAALNAIEGLKDTGGGGGGGSSSGDGGGNPTAALGLGGDSSVGSGASYGSSGQASASSSSGGSGGSAPTGMGTMGGVVSGVAQNLSEESGSDFLKQLKEGMGSQVNPLYEQVFSDGIDGMGL